MSIPLNADYARQSFIRNSRGVSCYSLARFICDS